MTGDAAPLTGDGPDAQAYKHAMAQLATGVTAVTALAGGRQHAMTANAFTSVSLDPPLVLVCIGRSARFHAAIIAAGQWAVSVLGAGDADVARRLARRDPSLAQQLVGVPYTPGRATGAATLDRAVAVLECRTRAVYDGGDHDIVLGEVLSVDVRDESAAPLLYLRGAYRQLDG